MGELFIEHRDPLFGIAIFVLLVAVVFLLAYMGNLRSQKRQEESLRRFSTLFETSSVDREARALLGGTGDFEGRLRFLAETYHRAGDYDKAIKIYLALLEQSRDLGAKLSLLEALGETYFKAGFLERAKKIFLEVLKNVPRNPKALFGLVQVCEDLGQFDEALEALDCLLELGEAEAWVKHSHAYLSAKRLIGDSFMSAQARQEELLKWLAREPRLWRLVIGYFKGHERALFWELLLKENRALEVADLLWNLTPEEIPWERVATSKALLELYRAKGYLNDGEACERFELEALRVMREHSKLRADLGFEYRCDLCGGSFPLEFDRCPSCRELLSGALILKVCRYEASLSFL